MHQLYPVTVIYTPSERDKAKLWSFERTEISRFLPKQATVTMSFIYSEIYSLCQSDTPFKQIEVGNNDVLFWLRYCKVASATFLSANYRMPRKLLVVCLCRISGKVLYHFFKATVRTFLFSPCWTSWIFFFLLLTEIHTICRSLKITKYYLHFY